MNSTRQYDENHARGLWLAAGLIVAALTLGALIFVGWVNYHTHVDSLNGDNVTETYPITITQATVD